MLLKMDDVLYFLIVLIFTATCLCAQTPTFEEMWNFCETVGETIEKDALAPPIIQNKPISDIKQIEKIYQNEKINLQQIAANFTSEYSKQKAKQEKLEDLIELGLFEEALKYLQSGEYVKAKGDYAFEYYLHLAFLQRWLGKEQKHIIASQEAKENIAKIDRKRKQKARKLKKKAKALTQKYEKKYFQWVHLSKKFQESKAQVYQTPNDQKAWKNFAKYADSLGYRLEEIVARRVIYRLAYNHGTLAEPEVVALVLAYLKTWQAKKALLITEAALKDMPSPIICALQVKAYIIGGNRELARREFRTLRSRFPDFKKKFEIIEKQELYQ